MNPDMRRCGVVNIHKCHKCYIKHIIWDPKLGVHWCSEWNANMGMILYKVETGEFKPPETLCHSNIDIFIRSFHLKYLDFLSQAICFWLGLKSAISSQAWAHKAAEQVWRLNQWSTQECCPSSPDTA